MTMSLIWDHTRGTRVMIPALPHHYFRMFEVKHRGLIPDYAPNGTYIFKGQILDLSHTIFADPISPLSDYVGNRTTGVLKRNDHTNLDHLRFWSYENIASIAEAEDTTTPYFRLLSGSVERQRLADFCAMLAVYWVIAHEDAHVYLGHCDYFGRKLGASKPGDSLFSELLSELAFGSQEEFVSAELDADRNASMRLVDEFFHLPYFHELPACVKFTEEGYSSDKLPEQERALILSRLILISCFIGLVSLDRFCKKNSIQTSDYPPVNIRHMSAAFHIIRRLIDNSNRGDYDMPAMSSGDVAKIIDDTSRDLVAVHRIIFDPSYGDFRDLPSGGAFFSGGDRDIQKVVADQITCQVAFFAHSPDEAVEQAIQATTKFKNADRIATWFSMLERQYRHSADVFWASREGRGMASEDRLLQELQHVRVMERLFGTVARRLR